MRNSKHASEASRPLVSFVAIDPESLPMGTAPNYTFRYIDIASATQGRLLLPDDEIEYRDAPSRARRVLRDQDVIMSTVRPNLKAFAHCRLPPGNFVASTGFAVLRSKEGTDPRFILYSILSDDVSRQIERFVVGSNYPAINSADVKRLRIPNISPGEQQRIGEIIGTVDDAIEQTEALIAKTQQIKAGLMQDVFTRGVTADGQLRPPREGAPQLYKESPLGWIPKEWEVDVFGNRVSVVDPNPSHRYPEEQETGVPICSTENFRGDDGFDLSRSKLMPAQVLLEQQQRCRFASNDVVFARKGRIGLARRYGDTPKVFSHTVVLFKARTLTIDQNWLLWLSRSRWFLDDIDRRMNSNSGVPTLGVAFINAVTVPFPQADEQQVINRHLDEVAARESSEDAELTKLRSLKAGLMHDLLTGRVPIAVETKRDVGEVGEVAVNV